MINKIAFYLMNKKGYSILDEIISKFGKDIVQYVVTKEDEKLEKDYYIQIKEICNKNNIKVYDKGDEIPIHKGYKIAIGWRWLIKDDSNLIVTHDSLLPKYRGYAPLVNMLINGEEFLGVTCFFADEEFDKGDIINQKKIKITYPMKIETAIETIIPLFNSCISEIIQTIQSGKNLVGEKQKEDEASYGLWRDEEDYRIDWNQDSAYIKRFVDAVGSPYGKARAKLDGEIIFIEDVDVYPYVKIETKKSIGKVLFMINQYPIIVCGKGLIKINKANYSDGSTIFPLKKYRSRFK